METVPLTLNAAESFEPDVKISPFVDPKVSVPSLTDSVIVSELKPAPLSVNEIRLPLPDEKTSEPFSLTVTVEGAVMAGA